MELQAREVGCSRMIRTRNRLYWNYLHHCVKNSSKEFDLVMI